MVSSVVAGVSQFLGGMARVPNGEIIALDTSREYNSISSEEYFAKKNIVQI